MREVAEPADAQNPAMTPQFQAGHKWRGVCDPDRYLYESTPM